MQKINTQLLFGLLLGFIMGFMACKLIDRNRATNSVVVAPKENRQTTTNATTRNNSDNTANENIPQKVYTVLQYIQDHKEAMPDYVGGRVFTNREKNLPSETDAGETINYQEWDVNPKVEGRNRGTERICTGSDGRSWYTNNHYRSFTLIPNTK